MKFLEMILVECALFGIKVYQTFCRMILKVFTFVAGVCVGFLYGYGTISDEKLEVINRRVYNVILMMCKAFRVY